MRKVTTRTKFPFAVSLTLIFAYGLMLMFVPPTERGVEALAAGADRPAEAGVVVRVKAGASFSDQAGGSLQ